MHYVQYIVYFTFQAKIFLLTFSSNGFNTPITTERSIEFANTGLVNGRMPAHSSARNAGNKSPSLWRWCIVCLLHSSLTAAGTCHRCLRLISNYDCVEYVYTLRKIRFGSN